MSSMTPIDPEINQELSKNFSGGFPKIVQVGPEKWIYPGEFRKYCDELRNFQVRKTDVWITGYPRSGTTMTQEAIWLLTHDLDFEKYKTAVEKVAFFELPCVTTEGQKQNEIKNGVDPELLKRRDEHIKNQFKNLAERKDTRIIKAHSPFSLLPPDLLTCGAKVVYIARYVKDVIVSYYHLQQLIGGRTYIGDFKQFWSYLENNLLLFNPYWEHIKQGYEQRNNKNVLFIFYEDIRKDYRASFKKIADFIGKDLSEAELDALVKFMSFDNFKEKIGKIADDQKVKAGLWNKNEGNNFVRKGKCGGWREYFDDELNARADKWIESNMKRIGFQYPENIMQNNL